MSPKTKAFMDIFTRAQKTFGTSTYRLAGDGWDEAWKTVIVTLMSAQTRDEVTIPIAEKLFTKYPSLEKLAQAPFDSIYAIIRPLNYSRTKALHVQACANQLLELGQVPHTIDELILLPGVGRKTANLVISECFAQDGICVDTHVHRICNVLGLVKTKTPEQTEMALREIAPQHTWSKINRYFVLWGKQVRGRYKISLLSVLQK
jgi:endonuclease III